MSGNKSMVAQFREQQVLQESSAHTGLQGLAAVARHEAIKRRMERSALRFFGLINEGKEQEALVIEPSPTVRLLLEMHLKKAGHQVILYAAVSALMQERARFQQEPPEVIFLAVDTTLSTWLEEAQEIRRVWGVPTLLIVLLSCRESKREQVQRSLNALPALYVHKPFQLQFVLALVFALHAVSTPPVSHHEKVKR